MPVIRGALLLLLILAAPAAAGPIAHRQVLPNGIVLLVAERPAIPIVAVRLSVQAGSVLDPSGHAGLAQLTAALLTRGTGRRTGPALDAAIESVGGQLEAGAGRDSLTVSLAILKKDWALGLDLLQEVVRSPVFPPDEVTRKVGEIQAAIQRSEESPGTVAARAIGPLLFPGHPYGVPVEGTKESVGGLTRDDVVGFHRAHFRPDTTVVAVVGAVTVAEARREIQARFGDWVRPAAPLPQVGMAPPRAPAREETMRRELTQATIIMGQPAVNQQDPDYFPLAVASYILGGGSASRLYTRVREEGGLAYSVWSYVAPGKFGASTVVAAQTRTAEVQKVLGLIRAELTRLGRDRVTDEELALAKAYLAGSFPLRLDTSGKVADMAVAVEQLGLGLDYPDRYVERIRQVTVADVQRVARRYLAADAFSRVIVGQVP